MKPVLFLVPTVVLLMACLPTLSAPSEEDPQPQESVTAFVNVHVVPMDEERILENQTVIVRNGRIDEVGSSDDVSVPDDALRIDGEGRYLIPGLAEMHGHIPPPSAPEAYTDAVLFMYVANGITTVRGMQGHENQLALRERVNGSDEAAPTLYLAGPGFSGGSIDSPEQAEEQVRTQHEEGWDLLKVLPGLTLEEYDAMARTANEVGIRFAGHVPDEVGLEHALEMGQETFDHLDGYIDYLNGESEPIDDDRLAEAVRLTREANAWVVPTMVLWETLQGAADLETVQALPGIQYMPPEQVQQWTSSHEQRLSNPDLDREAVRQHIDNRMRLLEALNEGGVDILMGTDAPQQFSVPGFSLRPELQRMAEAGMTPYEILKSGTANVGRYFENEDDFGTIAAGQRADLILVGESPLEDIANVWDMAGVMVRGRWLPQSEIQEHLDEIEASYSDP